MRGVALYHDGVSVVRMRNSTTGKGLKPGFVVWKSRPTYAYLGFFALCKGSHMDEDFY